MTDLFLKLLGVPANDAVHIAKATVAFRGGLSVGWYVFIIIVVAALVVWIYKSTPVTVAPWRRYTLAALRVVFLALLIALLLRPVLAFTVEGSIRRVLVMLVDGSASMQIADPRLDANDQKRAAIAKGILDPKGELKQTLDRSRAREFEQVSRLELTKAALQNERIDLLPRLDKEFDLSAFSFGQGLAELSARKLETNVSK